MTFSPSLRRSGCAVCSAIVLLMGMAAARGGSATWQLNPASSDWNNPVNWMPTTVPNSPSDIATFGISNQTNVMLSADIDVNSIVYDAGASAFNTTIPNGVTLMVEEGITNNSAATQTFVIQQGTLTVNGGAISSGTIDQSTDVTLEGSGSSLFVNNFSVVQFGTYNIEGGAQVFFSGFASLGYGTPFILSGNGDTTPGLLQFDDDSGASGDTITLNGDGAGANCVFTGRSSVFSGTFNVNGADSAAHAPGTLTFAEGADGGGANMIANGGTNGGAGGKIIYRDSTFSGGLIELHGNASLDLSEHQVGISVKSLSGDGAVYLGARNLTYNGDDKVTFTGIIQDGGLSGMTGGSLSVNGRGALTLTAANTYSGGTTIATLHNLKFSTLNVSNSTGSGTGSGPVTVSVGILGGKGIITGPVTAAGVGPTQPGTIAPAAGGQAASTLTIRSSLTFKGYSLFSPLLQARGNRVRADRVNARGVIIESGARFALLANQLQTTLRVGTSFTLIGNTATTPISGTFVNLADGAVLSVNGNNFQANYEGGDGNDLTLTVVP